jgi:hypothetical protein
LEPARLLLVLIDNKISRQLTHILQTLVDGNRRAAVGRELPVIIASKSTSVIGKRIRQQSTHKRHSTQISGWLLYVCMPPVDSRRPSGTIDATEDQLGAWPTFMGCL